MHAYIDMFEARNFFLLYFIFSLIFTEGRLSALSISSSSNTLLLPIMIISFANLMWLSYVLSKLMPLLVHLNALQTSSRTRVNNLADMIPP